MVPINTFNNQERIDRLNQSIDYAIRDLLDKPNDPLSLAAYLHIFANYKVSSINADRLATWGIAWIRRIFIEGNFSQRKDEEIASASLAVMALNNTSPFEAIKDEVIGSFKKVLSREVNQSKIPLRNPTYGTILLLAAHRLKLQEPNLQETSQQTGKTIVNAISGGRLFGLSLGIELLETIGDTESLEFVKETILRAINAHNTTYEDQIYLLQGLWQLYRKSKPDDQLMEATKRILEESPTWQYLMNGIEDISPAGDGQTIIFVSHLIRSSLLDVLKNYHSNEDAYNKAQIDAVYTVRVGVSWSAFGFYVLVFLFAWAFVLYPLIKYGDSAIKYWVLGDYSVMSKSYALLYLFGINGLIYLGIVTIKMVPILYKVFVKSQIGSDKRIKEYLLPKFWESTKLWLGIMALEILLGTFVELIIPSLQHTIGKPD